MASKAIKRKKPKVRGHIRKKMQRLEAKGAYRETSEEVSER
ncbi:MAG: hypothetical protein ACLFPU_06450 [Dehalococcoidia bacterium]